MPYTIEHRGEKYCVVKKATGTSMGCHPTRKDALAQQAALYANEPAAGYRASPAAEPSGILSDHAAREGGSTAGGDRTLQTSRLRVVAASTACYDFRIEQYMGRDHYVVPVVALVQGVVHAMNSQYAELVTVEEFSRKPGGWNGRPVFLGHPEHNGAPVSGNDPQVLEDECIGIVFNTSIKKNKLTMEAWIDAARAQEKAPELLSRIKNKQSIEISVGVFVDTDAEQGVYNDKHYNGSWHDIVPDHLALLPAADLGACSIEMGCGVRAAKENEMKTLTAADCMYVEWLKMEGADEAFLTKLRAARNIPTSERDKMPDEDFAGPNRSFPIQEPQDVDAAAHSLGRAKGNRNEIKRRIIAIAYRKGDSFVAQLPEDWKKKTDQTKAAKSLFRRIVDAMRSTQDANEMTSDDLKRRLYEALKEVEPNLSYVDVYHPVTDPSHVVYCVWIPSTDQGVEYGMGYQTVMYERAFDLGDNGVITLNPARIEVEPVMRYEPVEGAEPTTAKAGNISAVPKDTAAGAPGSCNKGGAPTAPAAIPASKETDMFETITKALTGAKATPEQEAQVVAFIAGGFKTTEAVTEKIVEKPIEMTREQAVEKFGFQAAEAYLAERKTKTIGALKATGRCKLTDEQLAAKSQDELDQLVELAGSNVRAAIDFGGQGAPKDPSAKNEAPAPPSLDEALKADRVRK